MVGAIGTGKVPHLNHRFVGDSPRLPVRAIPRFGTVTLTWPENLASASLTRASPTLAVISTGGDEIMVVLKEWAMPVVRGRQRGIRTRFVCPRCEASRDALHWIDGEWCCRGKNCGNLAHASRHRQRYCPAIARRERLRRKLIRTRPGGLRARWLREQIRREGKAMLAHLERVNRDLAKRSKRHARHDRASAERTG